MNDRHNNIQPSSQVLSLLAWESSYLRQHQAFLYSIKLILYPDPDPYQSKNLISVSLVNVYLST